MKNKQRPLKVMNDPKLDRIFTEAYREAFRQAENLENDKQLADHIDAYAEIFERDLYGKDLSAAERQKFVAAFRTYIKDAKEKQEIKTKKRKRIFGTVLGSIAGAAVLSIGIYILAAQPFKTTAEIESELSSYMIKVDEGLDGYADKYFSLLKKHGSKLPPGKAAEYSDLMYDEVDEHFNELLAKVEAGELRYADDAKKWADILPDPEEREVRKQAVDNAFQEGLGESIGSTWETVKREAGEIIEEAGGFLKGIFGGDED